MAPMTVDLRVPGIDPNSPTVRCRVLAGMAGYLFPYKGGTYQSIVVEPEEATRIIHVKHGKTHDAGPTACEPALPAFGDNVCLAQRPDGCIVAIATAVRNSTTITGEWRMVSTTHLAEARANSNLARYRIVLPISAVIEWTIGLSGFFVYGAWILAEWLRVKRPEKALDAVLDRMSGTITNHVMRAYVARKYLQWCH